MALASRHRSLHPLAVLVLAALLLALALPAPARAVSVGIADQHAWMFTDARFQALGIGTARFIVPYDSVLRSPRERRIIDEWVRAAQARRVEPLIAFNHSRSRPGHLPSAAEYSEAVRAFMGRYPGIRNYSPWNEPNHPSQPTAARPDRVAEFYGVVRGACGSCRVVAGDVLDSNNMISWTQAFRSHLREQPRLWALHPYADANRTGGGARTKAFLRAFPGELWLTETGGLVQFVTRESAGYPYDEGRAARSVARAFAVARSDRRITRLYLYQWRGVHGDGWDSAFISPSGKARPALEILRRELRRR